MNTEFFTNAMYKFGFPSAILGFSVGTVFLIAAWLTWNPVWLMGFGVFAILMLVGIALMIFQSKRRHEELERELELALWLH